MAQKATKRSTTTSTKVSAQSKSKVAAKKSATSKASSVTTPNPLSSFFSSLRSGSRSATSSAPRIKRKYYLPLLGLLVLLVLAWLASRYLVVAWVDKRPITRFAYYNQLDQKYGKDLKEQMIVESLIDSEAQKRGISVTQPEITAEIAKIETEQGGASNLDQVLQTQGITRPELQKLVRLQLIRQKMFADSASVTDAEVNDYITQNKASLPAIDPNDASAAANMQDNVRNQLKQQKLNATFSSWLQQNINSDRVIRL